MDMGGAQEMSSTACSTERKQEIYHNAQVISFWFYADQICLLNMMTETPAMLCRPFSYLRGSSTRGWKIHIY